jgi:hypothetical protein
MGRGISVRSQRLIDAGRGHPPDGRLRVLREFNEPMDALRFAAGLRWAGAAARVVLSTARRGARS